MRTILSRPLPYLIALAALAIIGVWLVAAGSITVVDETGGVQAAYVVNSGPAQQHLHGPLRGYFFAVPHMEGTVEVRCAKGVRKQAEYVTGGVHTIVQVAGRTPCERLIEAL